MDEDSGKTAKDVKLIGGSELDEQGVVVDAVTDLVTEVSKGTGASGGDPSDPDVQLNLALQYTGIKDHLEVINKLTPRQKKEMIALSQQHKNLQDHILPFFTEGYGRLEILIKEIKRLGLPAREGLDKPGQALVFNKFVKDNLVEKDFEEGGIFHWTFTSPISIDQRLMSGFHSSKAPGRTTFNRAQLNSILSETGAQGPGNGGWLSVKTHGAPDGGRLPAYDKIITLMKRELERDNNSDPITAEEIGSLFYLELLNNELISRGALDQSTLLNFRNWVSERIKQRTEIGNRVRKIAGLPPKSASSTTSTGFVPIDPVEVGPAPPTEVVEGQRRFQDQCFLTNNVNRIMESTGVQKEEYANFISVVGEPFIATNNLTFHKGQRAFTNLTSTEMSLLLPKIRLSKVVYESGDSVNELISIPFIFGTHNDFKDAATLTMGKRARGDDAGIESFTFAFEGQDYATADKILVCNATYFFKSMSDFIAQFSVNKSNKKFRYSYSDLAAYPAGERPFTIKADVGWETPSDLSSILGSHRAKKVKNAATAAKLSMFMNVVSFNYEVNEDGSLKVFAEYRGWINDMLSGLEFDIFTSPSGPDSITEWKITVAEYLLSLLRDDRGSASNSATQVSQIVHDGVDMGLTMSLENNLRLFRTYLQLVIDDTPGAAPSNAKRLEVFFNDQSTETKQFGDILLAYDKRGHGTTVAQKREFQVSLIESARRLVAGIKQESQLINHGGLLDEVLKEKPIYVVNVPEASLSHYQKPEVNRNLSNPLSKTAGVKDKGNDYFSVSELGTKKQKGVGDNLISATNKAFRTRKKNTEQSSSHFPEAGGVNSRFNNGYNIYFITFGAILDVVMKRVYNDNKNSFIEKFKVLVGSASTERGAFKKDNISIADIPVSLDLFTYWYLTEVMERDQTTYGVTPFIQNMLSKLILPALGADCQENAEVSDLYTIKGQVYNTRGKVKKMVGGNRIDLEKGDRVNATDISIKRTNQNMSLKNMDSYYHIFMNAQTALKGTEKFNEQRDGESKSILTLGTGYNRGLTRSIKFKGNDIPYFQEAADATLKDSRSDYNVRRMLKFHNADVELFGNTIFYPGMIVYIAPNFPGIRTPFGEAKQSVITPKTIASSLGIGGYYVITKVTSNIDSSGGFKTTIVANYEAGAS